MQPSYFLGFANVQQDLSSYVICSCLNPRAEDMALYSPPGYRRNGPLRVHNEPTLG